MRKLPQINSGLIKTNELDRLEQAVSLMEEEANRFEQETDWGALNTEIEAHYEANAEQAAESFDYNFESEATVTDMVRSLIEVDGRPFEIDSQPFIRGLLDLSEEYPIGSRNQLWATSRQIGKSTSQAAKLAVLGAATPAFKALYVAPRGEQVSLFSSQRFRTICEDSPNMSPWVDPNNTLWQVFNRSFKNGSTFTFRSCYLSADPIRGITAQMLAIDEIQDIISDGISVIEACQSRFPKTRFRCYAGTHKTTSNVINRLWQNTCQFEWLIKCDGCNTWNFPDESIIAEDAYRCTAAKCRKKLNMLNGAWVPQNTSKLDESWGFRISQLFVPYLDHADVRRLQTDPNITRQKFYNEILGLPYDEGSLVLTPRVMAEASLTSPMSSFEQMRKLAAAGHKLYAGVDYGTGLGVNPSFTVLAIGYWNPRDFFEVLYMKKFVGPEAELSGQPALINRICRDAGVFALGCDWGFGADKNARLISEFGWRKTGSRDVLLEFQYTRQNVEAVWKGLGEGNDLSPSTAKYMLDRTKSMGTLIDAIRRQKTRFFRTEDMSPYLADFTSIYVEYDDRTNTMTYDHSYPDDAFHAVNYAYSACRQFRGVLTPTGLPKV